MKGCNKSGDNCKIYFQQTYVIIFILTFYTDFGERVGRIKVSRLIFGRLFLDDWFEGSLIDKIYDFLLHAEEIKEISRGVTFCWVFADVEKTVFENKTVIFGKLAKIKEEKIHERYDKKTRRIIEKIDEDEQDIDCYSDFVIDCSDKIITFEEKTGIIRIKNYKKIFSTTYNQYYKGEFSRLKIGVIPEKERIYDMLNEYDKINYIKYNIYSPNPKDRDEFRSIKKIMENGNFGRWNSKITGKEEGIKKDNMFVKQPIELIDDGYGDELKFGLQKGEKQDEIDYITKIKKTVVKTTGTKKDIIKAFIKAKEEYFKRKKEK